MAKKTDEQKAIDKVNELYKDGRITRGEAKDLRQTIKERATDSGQLGASDRKVISKEKREALSPNSELSKTPASGGPNAGSRPTSPPPPTPPPPPPSTVDPIPPTPVVNPAPAPAPVPTNNVSTPAPAPSPVPLTPAPMPAPISTTTAIKQASPDIIIFDEQIDPEFLVQAFFEEFGGTELINISRSDLINGEDVSYSPIINLSTIKQNFNPNNIISINAFQDNLTQYGIDLVSRGVLDPYFDANGDLVIEIEEVKSDESIEVQMISNGTISRIEP